MTSKTAIAKIYDDVAGAYVDRTCGALGAYLDRIEFVEVSATDPVAKSVLDLGCGVGRVARLLGGRAGLYCGVDLSHQMVRTAARLHSGEKHTVFVCGDASSLPFRPQQFELITCFGLYEYIEDLVPYLQEVTRLLCKGGIFIFTCHTHPGARYFNRRGQYRRVGHTAEHVRNAGLGAGLRVVSVRPVFVLPNLTRWLLASVRRLPMSVARRRTMELLGHLDGVMARQAFFARNAKEFVVVCQSLDDSVLCADTDRRPSQMPNRV